MASNTKAKSFGLTKSGMEDTVSTFMCEYPCSRFYHNKDMGVTVLVRQEFINSNVMQVSTAVCSPDEKKYRKYVGEYLCADAYINGRYINIPAENIWSFVNSIMN